MISIYTIFDGMELTSIYLCVPDPDTFTVTTIYDVRVHDAEDPSIYERGVVDPIGSSDPQKVVDIYLADRRVQQRLFCPGEQRGGDARHGLAGNSGEIHRQAELRKRGPRVPGPAPGGREIGGLGILMVKKSMDDVQYQYKDGCNILTLKKQL